MMMCHEADSPRFRSGFGVLHSKGGYTFLEIAIALTVVAVLFAAVIPLATPSRQESRLRDAMGRIETLVRESRLEAEKTGRPVTLICESDRLTAGDGNPSHREARLDHASMHIRLWQESEWSEASGQKWSILPAGLVTPASIRLEDRQAWLENDFDPLTGDAINERYSF